MTLAEVRAGLKTDLEATGYKVLDHVPENITPPVILMTPGDPYISDGDNQTFGNKNINFELILIVKTKQNKFQSADLDKMIEKVIEHLDSSWDYTVNQPLQGIVNDDYQLFCVVDISSEYEI